MLPMPQGCLGLGCHARSRSVLPDVTYVVDLSHERAMWLSIEPRPSRQGRRFVPGCFVCLDSRACSPNLTLTAGSKHRISFLCDDLTRLWMNAEKTFSTCPSHPVGTPLPARGPLSPPCPVFRVGPTA